MDLLPSIYLPIYFVESYQAFLFISLSDKKTDDFIIFFIYVYINKYEQLSTLGYSKKDWVARETNTKELEVAAEGAKFDSKAALPAEETRTTLGLRFQVLA